MTTKNTKTVAEQKERVNDQAFAPAGMMGAKTPAAEIHPELFLNGLPKANASFSMKYSKNETKQLFTAPVEESSK